MIHSTHAMIHVAMIHLTMIHLTVIHLTVIHLTVIHLTVIHLTVIHLTVIHLTVIHLYRDPSYCDPSYCDPFPECPPSISLWLISNSSFFAGKFCALLERVGGDRSCLPSFRKQLNELFFIPYLSRTAARDLFNRGCVPHLRYFSDDVIICNKLFVIFDFWHWLSLNLPFAF